MNAGVLARLLAVVGCAGGVLAGASVVHAQEVTQPTLTLSSDIQAPGAIALITITLRIPEGAVVRKAESEVSYPGQFLEFESVRRGLVAEGVEAQVTSAPMDPSGDLSRVRITITAKQGSELASGPVAELRFVVSDKEATEAKAELGHKATVWAETNPPKTIEPVTTAGGEVGITRDAPLFACFFYMH